MSDAAAVTLMEPGPIEMAYSIRYIGGDAQRHALELNQLGMSLQGFARILAVCGHLARTGRYNKQYDSLSVRVYAVPVQEHRCYEVLAQIQDVALSKEAWSGFGGVALTLLAQHVFGKRGQEEMKHLSDALKQSMGQNAAMVDRLLGTVERMADALQPAAKQALAPIGSSCDAIGIYSKGASSPEVVLDQRTKEALMGSISSSIETTREYGGVISEMDMETGNCRVTLESDPSGARINATITDPVGKTPNNPYAMGMAQLKPLRFLAKAEIDAEGSIVRLYISDIASPKA